MVIDEATVAASQVFAVEVRPAPWWWRTARRAMSRIATRGGDTGSSLVWWCHEVVIRDRRSHRKLGVVRNRPGVSTDRVAGVVDDVKILPAAGFAALYLDRR